MRTKWGWTRDTITVYDLYLDFQGTYKKYATYNTRAEAEAERLSIGGKIIERRVKKPQ